MAERIFRRKLYEKMLQWKQERDGKTALLIKGARRVGTIRAMRRWMHSARSFPAVWASATWFIRKTIVRTELQLCCQW